MQRRRLAKVAIVAVLIVLAVWVLFTLVFPWVDRQLNDPVLSAGAAVGQPVVAAEATRR